MGAELIKNTGNKVNATTANPGDWLSAIYAMVRCDMGANLAPRGHASSLALRCRQRRRTQHLIWLFVHHRTVGGACARPC